MKVDLDELERKARAFIVANPVTLIALIARIRELEADIREWIEVFEEDPKDFTQCRALLEKGVVLP